MGTIFSLVFTAAAAAMLMTLIMGFLSSLKIVDGDVVVAFGSLVTRKPSKFFPRGLMMHFALGCLYAIGYFAIWYLAGVYDNMRWLVLSGAIIGCLHGIIAGFILVVLVAEHHPLRRLRMQGFGVTVSYILGHILFGAMLGGLWGMLINGYVPRIF